MSGVGLGPWGLMFRRSAAIFHARYASHSLGFLWHFIHPAMLIGMYSVVFGWLVKRDFAAVSAPYPVFLCAGLLPWIFFSDVLSRGASAFRANRVYLRKLAIPDQIFVGEVVVSALATFVIQFGILIGFGILFGIVPSWTWIGLPLPILILAMTGFGFSLGLATFNAYFPDVHQMLVAILRLAIWTAPVIFPLAFYAQSSLGWLVRVNPATSTILSVRLLYIDGQWPSVWLWAEMFAWAGGALLFGLVVHRVLKHEIRDVV